MDKLLITKAKQALVFHSNNRVNNNPSKLFKIAMSYSNNNNKIMNNNKDWEEEYLECWAGEELEL